MNFKIDDILNGTVDGVSKETIVTVISEVIDGDDVVATVGERNNQCVRCKKVQKVGPF